MYPVQTQDDKAAYEHKEDLGTTGTLEHGTPPSERVYSDDPNFEKRTIRKIDMRLIIILGACYAVSLIDRTNISVARVAGMARDLKLTVGERYSVISLVFFVTYIIFELPSNIMLRKVGAKYWLAAIVGSFGAIMTGMAFVKTYEQLLVCRLLLGIAEAGFFPACSFLIATWYKRHEVQTRMACFYLGAMVISGFSNIIGYGISTLNGRAGLAGWRWIFLVFGIITLVLAIAAFFLVVDFPDKSTFLTPEQKAFVIDRVDRDRGDALPDKFTFALFKTHIADWKIWCFAFLFMSATTGAYAFSYFLPIILAGNGYSQKLALCLSAPPYVFAAIYTYIVALASDKTKKRAHFITLNCLVCFVGLMITAFADKSGVRYFGTFPTIAGCQANVPSVISYSQNNITRHSKRSVTSALVIGFGGIGGIVASTVYRQADYPKYIPGLACTAALQIASIAMLLLLSIYFKKQNKKVDEGTGVNEETPGFKYTI